MKRANLPLKSDGAEDPNRTGTTFRSQDFKSYLALFENVRIWLETRSYQAVRVKVRLCWSWLKYAPSGWSVIPLSSGRE